MRIHQSPPINKVGIFGIFICLFYLTSYVHAENKIDPSANLNRPPFLSWRSAAYCLKNTSTFCPEKYTLNLSGLLNIDQSDREEFCTKGCANHTSSVLNCIHYVKKDFFFANKANINDIREYIKIACDAIQGSTKG